MTELVFSAQALLDHNYRAAALRGLEDGVYLLGQWWIWLLNLGYYFVVTVACFFSLWAARRSCK